jgi:hypothetical protein
VQSSEILLIKALTWVAQALMGTDLAAMPCQRMLPLLGEPVLDLLGDKLPVSQAVRVSVLNLIRLLVAGLRDGCSSAAGVCSFAHPDYPIFI